MKDKKLCESCKFGQMRIKYCRFTKKNIRRGRKKCKYYKEYKGSWAEILEYHDRHVPSSNHIYDAHSQKWKRPQKPDRRWNEPR